MNNLDLYLKPSAQRIIEENWKNTDEAFVLLALINAEFTSDPMSVQCFDERIVERVKWCVARRKAYEAKRPFGF